MNRVFLIFCYSILSLLINAQNASFVVNGDASDNNITDENGETGLLMASFHLPKELNVAIYEKNNKAIQDYMTRILENNNQHSDYNTICHYIYCTTILFSQLNKID